MKAFVIGSLITLPLLVSCDGEYIGQTNTPVTRGDEYVNGKWMGSKSQGNFSQPPTYYQPTRRNQSNLERPRQQNNSQSDQQLMDQISSSMGLPRHTLIADCSRNASASNWYDATGEYKITYCPSMLRTMVAKRYVFRHELSHTKGFIEGGRELGGSEEYADNQALIESHNQNDDEAIKYRANVSDVSGYESGKRQARQLLGY